MEKEGKKKFKILVVDDSLTTRNMIRNELEEGGYEVCEASDGIRALTTAAMTKPAPDLITLDIEMPSLDGYETCRRFREKHYSKPFTQYKNNLVPIIFITANDTLEGRKKGFKLGATDFVTKPFAKGEIVKIVDNILQPKSIMKERTALVAEDSIVVRNIICKTLEQKGIRVIAASNGVEALSLFEEKHNEIDLILTDLNMPEMGGDELCRRIRTEYKMTLPILFLSAVTEQKEILKIYQVGATDYITKPFAVEELFARILVHLEARDLINKLDKEKKKTQLILESSGEGIVGLDAGGHVIFFNPAAENMLMWSASAIRGKKLSLCFKNRTSHEIPFHDESFNENTAFKDTAERRGTDEIIIKKNGSCFPVEYVIAPTLESGQVTGSVVSFNDITERLEAEKALQEAHDKLEQRVKERTAELAETNETLEKEIGERKKAQTALQKLNEDLEKRVQERTAELDKKNRILEEIAVTDGLTQLYNHQHIIGMLAKEVAVSNRYSYELAIIMFDIDFFKKCNDTYGHQFGDKVLVEVAKVLKDAVREVDIPGRYGGEEFLVILPATDLDGGKFVAERIRTKIEALTWEHEGFVVTISGGLAAYEGEDHNELIVKADDLLYKAKENGRNRIEL